MAGGNRGNTHIDRAASDAQADAAILRQALFGNVELGHHLYAADHGCGDSLFRCQHFAQHAIDAEAHHEAVLERLDVNIRGVLAHRLGEQGVDQADDRCVVFAFQKVGGLGQCIGDLGEIERIVHVGGHGECIIRTAFVKAAQQSLVSIGIEAFEFQRAARVTAQFGQHFGFDTGTTRHARDVGLERGDGGAMTTGEAEAGARGRGVCHVTPPCPRQQDRSAADCGTDRRAAR